MFLMEKREKTKSNQIINVTKFSLFIVDEGCKHNVIALASIIFWIFYFFDVVLFVL